MGKERVGRLFAALAATGALALCAGPATAGASQTGDTTVNAVVAGFGPTDLVGQTFTVPAGTDNFLHRLDITGFNRVLANAPTSHIFISAVDGSGLPTGAALYTSPAFTGPAGSAPLTVYPNLTVTPGQKYAFYTEGSPGGVSFSGSNPGVYAGGEIVNRPAPAGAWTATTGDIAFLADFNTGIMDTFATISCPGPGKVGVATACTGTLKSGNGAEPSLTGKSLGFNTVGVSGNFSSCFVDASGNCSFTFTPTGSGSGTLFGQFVFDGTHFASNANTPFTANPRSSTTQTAASCAPVTLHVGETATCSVTVSDTDMSSTRSTPTGVTSWSSTGAGTFAGGGACGLTAQSLGVSKCVSIAFTPTAPGAHSISSAYAGDASHLASASAAAGSLTVLPAEAGNGPTGQRAAALKKCKKKHSKAKRKKCRKKAQTLPV
jgi:hypothetical protein